MMSGDLFNPEPGDERLCITNYEQKEYDSCSWENEDFAGKAVLSYCLILIFHFNNVDTNLTISFS